MHEVNTMTNFVTFASALKQSAIGATALTLLLFAKSLLDYSRTGPQLKREIIEHYAGYTIYAVARLTIYSFAVLLILMLAGTLSYTAICETVAIPYNDYMALSIGILTTAILIMLQFCHFLLYQPGTITASWQYRMNRLFPLWERLSETRLKLAQALVISLLSISLGLGILNSAIHALWPKAIVEILVLGLMIFILCPPKPRTKPSRRPSSGGNKNLNILMIGTDTLRIDHLGATGYHRQTSPNIDALAARGTLFTNCYVPLARTAPSLATLLTGLLPHRHGIYDNFVTEGEARLPQATLPRIFRQSGYQTAAITDWSGADLNKFDFGFDEVDAPHDQWNIKYYLRQGPMPLRLFLSLFCHNPLGRWALPEIFYQAGTPLTSFLGTRTRQSLTKLAEADRPFLLNVFMGTTHAPFGSEYPYYLAFSDRNYRGEAKFVMTTFRDPNEILLQQERDQRSFDVQKIMDLYDGCILNFDSEVGKIIAHLNHSGLAERTIIVIYSDHGIDFFENRCWGQGNTLIGQDYSARIPLLIIDPRRPGQGVVDHIIRSQDLLPTLAEMCGIQPPDGIDGLSLYPVLNGINTGNDRVVYQETGIWMSSMPGMDPDHLRYPNLLELLEIPDKRKGTMRIKPSYLPLVEQAKDRMIRLGQWKLVAIPLATGIQYSLYNMKDDPACLNDVACQYPETVAQLRSQLQNISSFGHRAPNLDTTGRL